LGRTDLPEERRGSAQKRLGDGLSSTGWEATLPYAASGP